MNLAMRASTCLIPASRGRTFAEFWLSNGCLCCTVQDDLAATLHALLKRRRDTVGEKPFERILIEASGLASPGPAVQTVLVDPMLVTQLRLDGVITLVHGQHIVQQLQEHPEAADRVAYADRVILNHCDQCDAAQIDAAEAAILACNHYAEITQTTLARVEITSLLDIRTWDTLDPRLERPRSAQLHDHAEPQAHHTHTSDVGTPLCAPLCRSIRNGYASGWCSSPSAVSMT